MNQGEGETSQSDKVEDAVDDSNNSVNVEDDNFINFDEAVEVGMEGDDNDVPMEEDDDDDDVDGDIANAVGNSVGNEQQGQHGNAEGEQNGEEPMEGLVQDMAICTLTSHQPSSVFTVDSYLDKETNVLNVVSGGGDDKAYLHKVQLDKHQSDQDQASTSYTSSELNHPHTDSVSSVATNESLVTGDLQKTPKYVAVGAYDGTIALYSPDTGEKIQVLDGPTDVEFVAFHPKGGSVSDYNRMNQSNPLH